MSREWHFLPIPRMKNRMDISSLRLVKKSSGARNSASLVLFFFVPYTTYFRRGPLLEVFTAFLSTFVYANKSRIAQQLIRSLPHFRQRTTAASAAEERGGISLLLLLLDAVQF